MAKCIKRLEKKSYFDPKSFRWIRVSPRTQVLIGCKKGRFKRGKCDIGTEAYEIVTERKRCPVDYEKKSRPRKRKSRKRRIVFTSVRTPKINP